MTRKALACAGARLLTFDRTPLTGSGIQLGPPKPYELKLTHLEGNRNDGQPARGATRSRPAARRATPCG